MPLTTVASLLLVLAPALVSGTIYTEVSAVPDLNAYDFIVVGAGPGGSTVANRLTENENTSVLLLEAGGKNDEDITLDVPLLCTRLTPMTAYDWNFTTTPQEGLNGRVVPFPRGIGLGGSSAVNCHVYTRGTSEDIDQWAALSEDESWGWDGMLPYFMKSENFTLPVDGHDVSGQYNASVHGTEGFIGTSVPGAATSLDERMMEAIDGLSEEFPFQLDWNSGEHLGVGWVQSLIKSGVRSSSKDYLTEDVLARPNLDVLLFAQAGRVLETDEGSLDLRSLEFRDIRSGQVFNATAQKEVVLSAGAVATPQLLLNSGIGNATLLSSLGIATLADLPSVGQNLTDHIGVSSTWRVNTTETLDTIIRDDELEAQYLEQWKTNKTGLFSDTSENHAAWLRVPDNSTLWDQFEDPAAGPNTAHYEFLFQNGLGSVTDEGNFLNIPVGAVSPASSGYVTINSTDLYAAPVIDPGLLSKEIDVYIVREAIRASRRFVASKTFADYILESLNTAETDEELEAYIRDNAVSFFHPVATAAMSPVNATWGVVDPDLKVKGVKGLRIVDASVAPRLPAAHTSAVVYGIAEKAADIIKGSL